MKHRRGMPNEFWHSVSTTARLWQSAEALRSALSMIDMMPRSTDPRDWDLVSERKATVCKALSISVGATGSLNSQH